MIKHSSTMDDLDYIKMILSSGEKAILLYGDSGTGKSTMARKACSDLGLEYTQAQCSANTDENTILGGFIPNVVNKDSEFMLIKKALTNAFETGKVCIIDELNLAQPDTLSLLNSMLDDVAVITLDNGEIITRHPDFRLICTENTGLEGCKYMNSATMNRFYVLKIEALDVITIYERLIANEILFEDYIDKELYHHYRDFVKYLQKESLDTNNTLTYRNHKKMYDLINYMYSCHEKPKEKLAFIKNVDKVISQVFNSNFLDVFIENQYEIAVLEEDSAFKTRKSALISAISAYYSSKYTVEDRVIVKSKEETEEPIMEDTDGKYVDTEVVSKTSDETSPKEDKKDKPKEATEESTDEDKLSKEIDVDLDVVLNEL